MTNYIIRQDHEMSIGILTRIVVFLKILLKFNVKRALDI